MGSPTKEVLGMTVDFGSLYETAHAAGMAAGYGSKPTPMVVTGGVPGQAAESWYVSEGCCGFAWVEFKGTTPWARWAKKAGKARKAYPTGCSIWVSEFGQSVDRKEAYAKAFAGVLKAHGIEAYANSRLD
jgi:hypothetical protein